MFTEPKNPQQLKDYILERLGAPIINIEVTESQIYQCIQRSLELYGEYHYNGLNRTFMTIYIGDDEKWTDGVFDLQNNNVFAVTKILRANSMTSLMTMDGTATYPWAQDFILGMTGFSNGCSSQRSFGPNAFGGDLGYFTMIMQYWNLMQKMFNPEPDYWFNDTTGQLKIIGNFKKGDFLVLEVWTKAYVDTGRAVGAYAGYGYAGSQEPNNWGISDIYDNADRQQPGYYAGEESSLKHGAFNNRWVKDYATALVKHTNGQVLAKHQGMQLPGGTTVDGIRLIEESNIEILRLREELDSISPGCPILIG